MTVWNFRTDRDRWKVILDRLDKKHILCQGLGGDVVHIPLSDPDFREKCKKAYNLRTTRRPTNLLHMTEFSDGDLLIVPHFPEDGFFLICEVDGDYKSCYKYQDKDPEHLNHGIRVRKVYGRNCEFSIYNVRVAPWYGRLHWMRLSIANLEAYEHIFREIYLDLQSNNVKELPRSELQDFFDSIKDSVKQTLNDRLNRINPSRSVISFETVCIALVEQEGYKLDKRNIYKNGGDVDALFTRKVPPTSFDQADSVLAVQIKKHQGQTDEHAVKQLDHFLDHNKGAVGCVMTLADSFTKEAEELAGKKDVILINGDQIVQMLMKMIFS